MPRASSAGSSGQVLRYASSLEGLSGVEVRFMGDLVQAAVARGRWPAKIGNTESPKACFRVWRRFQVPAAGYITHLALDVCDTVRWTSATAAVAVTYPLTLWDSSYVPAANSWGALQLKGAVHPSALPYDQTYATSGNTGNPKAAVATIAKTTLAACAQNAQASVDPIQASSSPIIPLFIPLTPLDGNPLGLRVLPNQTYWVQLVGECSYTGAAYPTPNDVLTPSFAGFTATLRGTAFLRNRNALSASSWGTGFGVYEGALLSGGIDTVSLFDSILGDRFANTQNLIGGGTATHGAANLSMTSISGPVAADQEGGNNTDIFASARMRVCYSLREF